MRRSVFISLVGHVALFGFFSLSFGARIPDARYVSIAFWGGLLANSQVSGPPARAKDLPFRSFFAKRIEAPELRNASQDQGPCPLALKPQVCLAFSTEKETFLSEPDTTLRQVRKSVAEIIFHPLLPYGFTLYFKDRQVAHVELEVKIAQTDSGKSALIKRKITSGNLEADLLIMRYIGRYLFIREAAFSADKWQTVKIDLSAKEYK